MNTITNYKNIQFGALIPLNKYKGSLLKLTEEDKIKIGKLQEAINKIDFELYQILKLFENKQINDNNFEYYANKRLILLSQLQKLQSEIKKIKINRFKIQNETSY